MRALLFIFIFTLAACAGEVEKPEFVIGEYELVQVLIDIHLLESKINYMDIDNKADTSFMVYNHFHELILEKHHLDSSTFHSSMSYYQEHPELLEQIYAGVIDSLIVREKNHRIE